MDEGLAEHRCRRAGLAGTCVWPPDQEDVRPRITRRVVPAACSMCQAAADRTPIDEALLHGCVRVDRCASHH